MKGRKLCGGHVVGSVHTAAHVEENCEAQWRPVGSEFVDCAALAAIDHFEIPLREVFHESPFTVPDRGTHGHEIDTGTERGLLVLCGPLGPPRKRRHHDYEG